MTFKSRHHNFISSHHFTDRKNNDKKLGQTFGKNRPSAILCFPLKLTHSLSLCFVSYCCSRTHEHALYTTRFLIYLLLWFDGRSWISFENRIILCWPSALYRSAHKQKTHTRRGDKTNHNSRLREDFALLQGREKKTKTLRRYVFTFFATCCILTNQMNSLEFRSRNGVQMKEVLARKRRLYAVGDMDGSC